MDTDRISNLETRFDRVDRQLDAIGESLRLLASIDERTTHLLASLTDTSKKISDHEKRIQFLEQKMYLIMTLSVGAGSLGALIFNKVF